MGDELRNLIDGYLDDQLSDEQVSRLCALVKQDPEHARRFARAMLLHERLRAEAQANALVGGTSTEPFLLRRAWPRRRWTIRAMAAAAVVLIAAGILWHGGTSRSASGAVVALDRMIEVAGQAVDRVYRIRVTDPGPDGARPPVFSGAKGRKPGIDGARLYVRGPEQFVLVRQFGNGTEFVTGSDGTVGWAIPPKGPIHLSRDTRRFRRAVPGEHEEIPFTDLQAGFAELRRSYELTLDPANPADGESNDQAKLVAVKKPGRWPGAERIVVDFDAAGVAHRVELSGLPPDEMRARTVVLELLEHRNLGSDFFKHESHHLADRPIDWE